MTSLPRQYLFPALLALTLAGATGVAVAAGPARDVDEEPEVTIIQRDADIIEEYRMSGRLYMIRVIPRRGVPYYLVDTDGDGNMETRRNEMTEDLMIPNWTLFRW